MSGGIRQARSASSPSPRDLASSDGRPLIGPIAAIVGAPAKQRATGGADLLDRHGIDLRDDLLARDDAAPGQELARDPLDAAAGRLERGEQRRPSSAPWRGRSRPRRCPRRPARAAEGHLHQLRHVRPGGAGADAEQAAIGEGPVEGLRSNRRGRASRAPRATAARSARRRECGRRDGWHSSPGP